MSARSHIRKSSSAARPEALAEKAAAEVRLQMSRKKGTIQKELLLKQLELDMFTAERGAAGAAARVGAFDQLQQYDRSHSPVSLSPLPSLSQERVFQYLDSVHLELLNDDIHADAERAGDLTGDASNTDQRLDRNHSPTHDQDQCGLSPHRQATSSSDKHQHSYNNKP